MKAAVVIPTYNRKYLVEQAIRSALSQSVELEVVVVDDGSRDGTLDHLFREFRLRPDGDGDALSAGRLTVIPTVNAERGAARNRGARWAIDRLGAQWLLFLDADDVLTAEAGAAFAHALRSLNERTCAAIRGEFTPWDGGPAPAPFSPRRRPASGPQLNRLVCEGRVGGLGATLVSASAFGRCGGFSEDRAMSGSEDYDFLCRLCFEGSIITIDKLITLYRHHGGNTGESAAGRSVAHAVSAVRSFLVSKRARGRRLITAVEGYGLLCRLGSALSRREFDRARALLRENPKTVRYLMRDRRLWRLFAAWALRRVSSAVPRPKHRQIIGRDSLALEVKRIKMGRRSRQSTTTEDGTGGTTA